MFNLRLCNAATIRYSLLKFGHMHLCGKDYKYFSPHCCKCNSYGCIAAIRCVNACHGPHSDSVYSGSEHRQFNSPRLVKREAGFPNPRRALIGSNQLWRVNDSPYYREYGRRPYNVKMISCHFDAIPCLACVRLKMCIYVIFKTYFYVLNCSTNALYICNVLLRKNVMIMNILTGYIVICYPSYILIVRAFWHA